MKNWRVLFQIKPIVMGPVEMILIRAGFAYALWTSFFFGIAQAAQTMPVGLAHFMDLSFLQHTPTFEALRWGFAIALGLWVMGVCTPLATGYMLFLMSAVGSLRNSYGNIHHGTQVVGMTVLGYFCGYVWHWLKTDTARSRLKRFLFADSAAHQTATWWALQAVAATYVVAGASKVIISGFGWITGLVNLPLHVEKIGLQHYFGLGDISRYEHAQDMAAMLAQWPTLMVIVVGSGLFFELFAFWALYSRWHAAIFGVILYIMHLQIIYLMQLEFPMNHWAILLLMINVPYLLLWCLRRLGLNVR
jgi:hypothetical protein